MKRFFFIIVMCLGFMALNAQDVEKTFAELKNEGNVAINAKDYQKALDLYEKALVKLGNEPITDTSMIYNMGYCAYSVKSYEKALKYFDQSISMDYKKVNSLMFQADSYKAMKKDAESLKALETALSIAPDDAKVKSKLTFYYVKAATGFYSKGSAIITKLNNDITAGKVKTTDPAYLTAEQKAKDEYTKALPLIEKALGFDPANKTATQLKTAIESALKG